MKAAAHELLDKANKDLQDRIDQATKNGDEVLAKHGKILQGILEDTRKDVDRMIDKTFEKAGKFEKTVFADLASERKAFFDNLNQTLSDFDAVVSHADAIVNHARAESRSFLRQMKKVADEVTMVTLSTYSARQKFRRLDGSWQEYKSEGVYKFKAVGVAL